MTTESASSDGVTSVPLWIGSPDRPVFAWLHCPEDGIVTGAAVLCPSMGLEAAYSARAVRALGLRLAHAGWAALRLDYAATGDSVGSWTDPGLVPEWLGNIRTAIDYVRGLGPGRVSVVGLRLGAALAAAELERNGPVDDLVLWDACATGRAFLREQTALAALRRSLPWAIDLPDFTPAQGEEGLVEAPGAVFAPATAAELGTVAIPRTEALASREFVLAREGRKPERALRERLTLPHVETSEIAGQEELFGEKAIIPARTLDGIVSWLSQVEAPPKQLTVPQGFVPAAQRAPGRTGVSERPLTIGPARIFGMLSEPEHGIAPSAPTVVFLNVGLIPHHGPGRLWVELARACAATGNVRALRIDLNGLGDSPTREGGTELRSFPVAAYDDMEDIHRECTRDGSDLIIMGVCSGADHAIELGLAAPVASICVINPALSFLRWGNDDRRGSAEEDPGRGDRQTWGTSGPLLTRAMASLERYRPMVRHVPTPGWWFVKRWLMKGTPVQALERLVQSGANVLLVLGSGESRRVYRGEERRLAALAANGGVRLETVPHLDHSLLERHSHDRVADLFGAYVASVAAQLSARPNQGSTQRS